MCNDPSLLFSKLKDAGLPSKFILYIAYFKFQSIIILSLGPCPTARQTNFLLQCDEDGSFQPLQCRKKTDSPTYLCQCVLPSTGVPLRGTQVELHNLADGPDCEDMGKIAHAVYCEPLLL